MKTTTLLITIALVAGFACAPRTYVTPTELVPLYPGMQPACPLAKAPCPGVPNNACPGFPNSVCPRFPNTGYTVQIYAFYDSGRAQRAACIAQQRGLPATVDFNGPYYRVRVGGVANRSQAERLRQQAISLGYWDAFVVSAPCR